MGACIGKKSSKYLIRNQPQSDVIQAPQPTIQNDSSQSKPSPSSSKKLRVPDDSVGNDDGECRISKIDESSINSELQVILDEQEMINEVLNQPFSLRVISVTDTELEYELANLIYEQTGEDNDKKSFVDTIVKCNDVS